ncbi:hypothetical protein ACIQZI_22585 [Peribacillus sp. NPDC096379]|uniref:hypothetical protein n=1 Tax=Peribacillus sp. NPDC096379 TaxID=3364393 RepID=UPI00381AF6DA
MLKVIMNLVLELSTGVIIAILDVRLFVGRSIMSSLATVAMSEGLSKLFLNKSRRYIFEA